MTGYNWATRKLARGLRQINAIYEDRYDAYATEMMWPHMDRMDRIIRSIPTSEVKAWRLYEKAERIFSRAVENKLIDEILSDYWGSVL